MKTIFIAVARGFIMRNILRSGVLESLKRSNFRVVILIVSVHDDKSYIPEYLIKEFSDKQTELIVLEQPKFSRIKNKIYKVFGFLVKWLVYSRNMWEIRSDMKVGGVLRYYLEGLIYFPLSKLHFFKKIARYIEYKFFYDDSYKALFDKYNPKLVFSTSIISRLDIALMNEAKRRGIKTVSMPKGWDNITNRLYRFVPDLLIVQNEEMKKGAIKMQRIKPEKISVCGFPQFDWYRKKEIIMNRKDFFNKIGLDQDRRMIFFGSEGFWIRDDEKIAKILINAINKEGVLSKPSSLFIRSHFSDAKKQRFNHYKGVKNVKIDDNFTFSDIFHDSCDPSEEEIIHFVNSIYHSDIIISFASTLSLDACCFLKPNINPAFKIFYNSKNEDISPTLYKHYHFKDVLKTGAVDLVYSEKELIDKINYYLLNPDYKKENRKALQDKLCYKVDGNSSRRIAEEILRII
jgi:hypothetical protein